MLEPTLSVVYPPGNPSDFIVTYLSPKKEKKKEKESLFTEYGWEHARKSSSLVVTTKKLGHLVDKRRITLYLHSAFSDRVFNRAQVERCYQILKILSQNATMYEMSDDTSIDVFYQYYHKNPGVFTMKRTQMITRLLQCSNFNILCFEVNQQDTDNYIDTVTWNIERKQKDETGNDFLVFTLIELIDNDWAYKHFYNYWNSLPNHEKCRTLLKKKFKLPNDVVNYIFEQLIDEHNKIE